MDRRQASRGSVGVVGAGAVGLTTAIVALEAGYRVTLYADRATMDTTSAKAAASFKPTIVEGGDGLRRILADSWRVYERITREAPESGVRLHTHWEASTLPLPAPWYLDVMRDASCHREPEVPGGYPYGWRYRTFFVDTPVYLPWLVRRLRAAGGTITPPRHFASLDELAALPHDIIFNCTGLGARLLCLDEHVIAVRGQIAIVGPRPQMDWSIKHDGFYVYPRKGDTVLGGTSEENVWDERPEESAIEALLEANRRILPDLRPSDVRQTYAGLRPYRVGGPRLETESVSGRLVVHNYGHGGAGISLCWGSAIEAVRLADS